MTKVQTSFKIKLLTDTPMTRHYPIGGFGTEPWLYSDRDAVSQRYAEPVCDGAIDRHCTPPALLFLPFALHLPHKSPGSSSDTRQKISKYSVN